MPRNSWTSLLEEEGEGARTGAAGLGPAPEPVDLPPEIRRLQEERRELEARMRRLTRGPSGPERSERRFPVTPLAQRRAADAAWARRRDRGAGRDASASGRDEGVEATGRGSPGDRRRTTLEEPRPPFRTGQRAVLEPAGRIGDGSVLDEPLSRGLYRRLRIPGDAIQRAGFVPAGISPDRVGEAEFGRGRRDPASGLRDRLADLPDRFSRADDRFTQVDDRFSDLPDRFTDVSTPTSGAARRVDGAMDRFSDLAQDPPLRDRFTDRLREGLSVRDRLADRGAALGEDPPLRSALDRYEARREELLAVRTGGSGDLEERSIRARARALAEAKMEREREAADDARVERARSRSRGEPAASLRGEGR